MSPVLFCPKTVTSVSYYVHPKSLFTVYLSCYFLYIMLYICRELGQQKVETKAVGLDYVINSDE